ncbi:MAG: chemotaxis protein CheB, partial [Rhodanobacter sp.]
QRRVIETEALSAELEAVLASAELMDGETGDATDGAGMFALDSSDHSNVDAQLDTGVDQSVGASAIGLDDLLDALPTGDEPAADVTPGADAGDAQPNGSMNLAAAAPAVGLDHLLDMLPMGDEPSFVSTAVVDESGSSALPDVPADWALVDDDAITPATFGVEKQTAAEYLAPDVGTMSAGDEPVLNLELVSMEEAVAPRPARASVEMHLDELHMALSRLVLTGATWGGAGAALAFYAALPATTQLTFLHTQHLRGQSAEDLVVQLGSACKLKVKLATAGTSTQFGEILVVPPGHKVRVRRDARVELQAVEDALQEPSIDDSFVMAADMFGRDAVAIVFSGLSTDSIAGTKAIHAGGGHVWVETAAPAYADMVHEISAAQIVEYSGTPEEMAAKLMEKFA